MEKEIESIYNELLKFSDSILELKDAITDSRIQEFEEIIGYKFPTDFVYFLRMHNGFSLHATEVLGIGKDFGYNSLDKIYEFERSEVENPMPNYFLPFSPDGYGNHYCMDVSRMEDELCPIVFWQHDYNYENLEDVETCNINFAAWINEVMIEWTLEDYNYDGSEK